jgi:hypothetical protein
MTVVLMRLKAGYQDLLQVHTPMFYRLALAPRHESSTGRNYDAASAHGIVNWMCLLVFLVTD